MRAQPVPQVMRTACTLSSIRFSEPFQWPGEEKAFERAYRWSAPLCIFFALSLELTSL